MRSKNQKRRRISRTDLLNKRIIRSLSALYELPELLVRTIYRKFEGMVAVVVYELKQIAKVKHQLDIIDDYNLCY